MKESIVLIIMITVSLNNFAQKITYSDLQKFSNISPKETADILYKKGFAITWAHDGGTISNELDRSYQFGTRQDHINIDIHRWASGKIDIQACYQRGYNNDYILLEKEIKKNLVKVRDIRQGRFVSTEYQLGDKYLYFTRSLCQTVATNYKEGTFRITSLREDY